MGRKGGFLLGAAVAGLMGLLGAASADTTSAPQLASNATPAPASQPVPAMITPDDHKHMLMQYCTACHNDKAKTAGMSVVPLDANNLDANQATWEKILRRLSLGEMPPKGMPRPPKEQITAFTSWLAQSLDANAAAHPDPGHATVRRMNRTEYANAVRDLLGINVDFSKDMPADDTGYGFDNIADVLTVSPTLMDRYINVAGKIARLATGEASQKPITVDYKITKDVFENAFGVASYNERASDDLPINSRGGGAFKYYAPYNATYMIEIYLNSGTQTEAEIDANNRYEVKVPLKAGLRTIGVSFPRKLTLDESLVPKSTTGARPTKPATVTQLPMDVQVDGARVQELMVPSVANGSGVVQSFYLRDVMQISVAGPYDVTGAGDTASRRKIFLCHPGKGIGEEACAKKIVTVLARHAYRRPVTAADMTPLMKMYAQGRKGADFEHGIEAAVEAVLGVARLPVHARERPAQESRPAMCTRSAMWSWRQDCPSSCGAASPTMNFCRWRRRSSCPGPMCSRPRSPACWPIQNPRRSPTTSPASGCICGGLSIKSPIAGPIRTSTCVCAMRC